MDTPKGYVNSHYLQTTAGLLREFKLRSYTLMKIEAGHKVLDVGCGPASDTLDLAQWVGPQGQVAGVDYDPQMIAEAEYKALQAGVNGWVSHKQGFVEDLPFPSNYFDSSRSERVFQHLTKPDQALAEMIRVTKPGGRIVIWDADWGTLTVDSDEVDTERKLVRVVSEGTVHNGYSGRQLHRMFKQQSLTRLSYEANTLFFDSYELLRQVVGLDYAEQDALAAGLVSREELNRWRAGLERADREGWFFGSVNGMLVSGEKQLGAVGFARHDFRK